MSDALTATAPTIPPTKRRKPTIPDRVRITPRVRNAVHAMVWQGLTVEDAAATHKINGGAFARSLTRPSVQALIRSEVEVLRTSAKPAATRRIVDLMGQSISLNVALKAAMHIDSDGKAGSLNVQVNTQVNIQPGYVIDVSEYAHQMPNLRAVEAK